MVKDTKNHWHVIDRNIISSTPKWAMRGWFRRFVLFVFFLLLYAIEWWSSFHNSSALQRVALFCWNYLPTRILTFRRLSWEPSSLIAAKFKEGVVSTCRRQVSFTRLVLAECFTWPVGKHRKNPILIHLLSDWACKTIITQVTYA